MALTALLMMGISWTRPFWAPDLPWYLMFLSWVLGGTGIGWLMQFIWHEKGRWLRMLRAAWRSVKRFARGLVSVPQPARVTR